jgi:hypothetical protein
MNLNSISIGYDKTAHSIVLFGSEVIPQIRHIHQEVMGAVVQYMTHESPPFCEHEINFNGEKYILKVTPCK